MEEDDCMRSLLITIGFAFLTILIIRTSVREEEEQVTLSPPIPGMIVGPAGVTDAEFSSIFRRGEHWSPPRRVGIARVGPDHP
jgi:hypothetical protein